MTRQETAKVLAILRVAYPAFYKTASAEEATAAVNLWTEMFSDEDASAVLLAVKAHIATDEKGYPPTIGAIKAALHKLCEPEGMSEMEAWGILRKAIGRSGYYSEAEFQKLPPSIKRIAGSPEQLRQWAMIEVDELETVVGSNFMRSYRAVEKAERERAMLPEGVRKMADKMRLPGWNEALPERKGRLLDVSAG